MPQKRRPPGPEDRIRADHIIALTREALAEFATVSESDFLARRLYQTSLAWYLQAIGEAAARISDESRVLVPGVPWRQIVGTRNRLVHGYDAVDHDVLWEIVAADFPKLVLALRALS